MVHREAGHLPQSFSPPLANRVVEDRQVRITFAGERIDGSGDFGAGFGVEPRIEPVLAVKSPGNVQLLVSAVLGRPLFRILRCGSGFDDLREIGELARGDVRAASANAFSISAARSASSVEIALRITDACVRPISPACHAAATVGIRSTSARPRWTRSDAHGFVSPDRLRRYDSVEFAPSQAYSPVRSMRSKSRQVASSP